MIFSFGKGFLVIFQNLFEGEHTASAIIETSVLNEPSTIRKVYKSFVDCLPGLF